MGNNKILIVIAFAGIFGLGCNDNQNKQGAGDSSVVSQSSRDTLKVDTSNVKQADSIHSYRNDRSTDSIAVGKNIPLKR